MVDSAFVWAGRGASAVWRPTFTLQAFKANLSPVSVRCTAKFTTCANFYRQLKPGVVAGDGNSLPKVGSVLGRGMGGGGSKPLVSSVTT